MIQALVAGMEGGLLALLLVLRLNPEVRPDGAGLAVSAIEWAVWGGLGLGIVLLPLLLLVAWRRPGRRASSVTAAAGTVVMLVLAGVIGWVDAEVLRTFLSGRAHRILGQDAVSLLGAALLVGLLTRWGRRSRRPAVCWAAMLFALAAPLVRIVAAPTPPPPTAESLRHGTKEAPPLLVVGVEGLDVTFLLTHADSDRFPSVRHLLAAGSWGEVNAFTPFLRTALWTSAATGCYPSRHGVKSSRAWKVPGLGEEPLRVLPWTPLGGRLLLPAWATEVPPPPSRVPPLWRRLGSRDGSTVWGWPTPNAADVDEGKDFPGVPGDLVSSLQGALEPFGEDGRALLERVQGDAVRCELAVRAMDEKRPSVWLVVRSLAEARRRFEPAGTGDVDNRVILGLELETLDVLLGRLLETWSGRGPVAVLSPYGMSPPAGWERLRRLMGGAEEWRTSPRACPNGALFVVARGAIPGHRFPRCEVVDMVPTLTYLLGLPLPAWVEGRVILDAITPDYLAQTPLLVEE